jgi:hypothetical protein
MDGDIVDHEVPIATHIKQTGDRVRVRIRVRIRVRVRDIVEGRATLRVRVRVRVRIRVRVRVRIRVRYEISSVEFGRKNESLTMPYGPFVVVLA